MDVSTPPLGIYETAFPWAVPGTSNTAAPCARRFWPLVERVCSLNVTHKESTDLGIQFWRQFYSGHPSCVSASEGPAQQGSPLILLTDAAKAEPGLGGSALHQASLGLNRRLPFAIIIWWGQGDTRREKSLVPALKEFPVQWVKQKAYLIHRYLKSSLTEGTSAPTVKDVSRGEKPTAREAAEGPT